jgi:hypothetical protein
MKTLTLSIALVLGLSIVLLLPIYAQTPVAEVKPPQYLTIRWGGRDNTHIIRPGGKVEFVGVELRKAVRPDRTDERSFYMNIVMNGLTKEGWEFSGITTDEIVMRRPTP